MWAFVGIRVLCLQKILEDLEDASNELMLSDEENIRYVIGECFVHMDKDAAEEKLEGVTDKVGGQALQACW